LCDVPAVAHRNKVDEAQNGRGAAGAHWHEIFTEYLSARDPYLNPSPRQRNLSSSTTWAFFVLEVAIDGLIIIIVMPRSRMVAEMKLHAWAEVHGYARAMMASPIANVVFVNVTTVV
jgi:hypothetical protein